MTGDRLVFYLGDHAVGRFHGRSYPTRSGRVAYSPYRGTGHLLMAKALHRGEAVACWFTRQGRRVHFDIVREEFVLGPPGGPSDWFVEVSQLSGASDAKLSLN